MPITISDKRRAEILEAIIGGVNDLRLALVQAGLMTPLSPTDLLITRAVSNIYWAVIAAAEGREQP